MTDNNPVFEQIRKDLNENDVVVYMKGTAKLPQCGFSGTVAAIFEKLQVPVKDINVLEDPATWQGIKEFNNWPTIPQVFVKGEFVGGCDILREMYTTGELQQLLADKGITSKAAS